MQTDICNWSQEKTVVPQNQPPQLLQRIERARRVVSLCSQATIRAYDEEALLFEACRILLDVGDYSMAWVGETRAGTPGIVPLAHAGAEPSGVRSVDPPWGNDTGRRSPTARAILEQRPQVHRNLTVGPGPQEGMDGTEFAAMCAFPIQFGPHGAGAIAIYAREPDAFAPEEVALLRELAGDLAVGVAGLRAKRAADQMEAQLEQAERRFRGLIEHAPIAIVQVTSQGKILIANQALADLLGYGSIEELLAQPPAALADHLEPEALAQIQLDLQAGPPYQARELRLRLRDGGSVWVDVQARNGNGERDPVIEAFIRDLTPARAAQLASSRLSAVVDASEEAIIGIDSAGIVQSWSRGAATLYEFNDAEAIGKPLDALTIPEDRRSEWTALLASLAKGERVPRFETLRVCKRGDVKEVSLAASPVLDAQGHIAGVSLLEHDVGHRNRAFSARIASERQEQEVFRLTELARMRSDFMGRASHELNTPLTPILLQVEALKDSPGLNAKQLHGLALIERNVVRLALLVKDLLSASALNSNHLLLKPVQFDLRALVVHAIESFQGQASDQGVHLEAVADAVEATAAVPSYADSDRVMQVLFNLLTNALKFTPRGGSITVQAEERDGMGAVTIKDTGLGFPDGAHPNLFRPFGRLHEDIAGTPVGTGLGLFISKGIIEASGGTLWAESPGVDKGCTVGFTLPLRPRPRPGRGIVAATGFNAPEEAKANFGSKDVVVDRMERVAPDAAAEDAAPDPVQRERVP